MPEPRKPPDPGRPIVRETLLKWATAGYAVTPLLGFEPLLTTWAAKRLTPAEVESRWEGWVSKAQRRLEEADFESSPFLTLNAGVLTGVPHGVTVVGTGHPGGYHRRFGIRGHMGAPVKTDVVVSSGTTNWIIYQYNSAVGPGRHITFRLDGKEDVFWLKGDQEEEEEVAGWLEVINGDRPFPLPGSVNPCAGGKGLNLPQGNLPLEMPSSLADVIPSILEESPFFNLISNFVAPFNVIPILHAANVGQPDKTGVPADLRRFAGAVVHLVPKEKLQWLLETYSENSLPEPRGRKRTAKRRRLIEELARDTAWPKEMVVQRRIVDLLMSHTRGLSASRLAEYIGNSSEMVTRVLKDLASQGVVSHRGKGAGSTWFMKRSGK